MKGFAAAFFSVIFFLAYADTCVLAQNSIHGR